MSSTCRGAKGGTLHIVADCILSCDRSTTVDLPALLTADCRSGFVWGVSLQLCVCGEFCAVYLASTKIIARENLLGQDWRSFGPAVQASGT